MSKNIKIFNDTKTKYLPIKYPIEIAKKVFLYEKVNNYNLNVIFVNDKRIYEINKKYLGHDSTTDVISFNLNEEDQDIEGEIYISIDTARKQAKEYNVSFLNEILRLVAHGALHLVGYADNTKREREEMHLLENKYIKLKKMN